MFKKIKNIGKKGEKGGELDSSEQRRRGSEGVTFTGQEKDPRGGSEHKER